MPREVLVGARHAAVARAAAAMMLFVAYSHAIPQQTEEADLLRAFANMYRLSRSVKLSAGAPLVISFGDAKG